MWLDPSRLVGVMVCQIVSLVAGPAMADQSGEVDNGRLAGATPVSRVLISEPITARAVTEALKEAWSQLSEPRCQALLTEFRDKQGNLLADNLSKGAGDLQSHLARLVFVDDGDTKSCGRGVLALTEPGSRVVHVCGKQLVWTWQHNRRHAAAALIHEALHTLGLGENPPTSREITRRVLKRCRAS